MVRPATLAVIVVALLAAGPAHGQDLADTHLFPVVSATPGLGDPPTQWASDVTVHNPSDREVTVGFQFFPEARANTIDQGFTGPRSFRIQLGSGATRSFENILPERFGITDAVKGMLLVTCSTSFFPDNDESARILAASRTYNVGSPAGTYGQTVPANFDLANVFGTPSIVTGAREDSRFRSNLGVATITLDGPITVHYRVLRPGGAVAAQGTRTVEPLSLRQWSFASLGVPSQPQPLTVQVWMDPADVTDDPCAVSDQGGLPNAILVYVSKVDGNPAGTGDAEFLYAVPTRRLNCD